MLKILDWISWICMVIAGTMLVVLIVIFGWLVFGRYVLNNTPTWVEQVSLLLVAYITFLGAAIGIRDNTHLSIDFIREAMPSAPRFVLSLIADASLLVFGVAMGWQGYILTITNTHRAIPMIDMPEAWRSAPLAVCGVLTAVFSLVNLLRRFVSTPDAPAGE